MVIPDFGYVAFVGEKPQGLPKPKVVRCGTKNRNHAPIKVNRAIGEPSSITTRQSVSELPTALAAQSVRTGVRVYQSGESIDWAGAYN